MFFHGLSPFSSILGDYSNREGSEILKHAQNAHVTEYHAQDAHVTYLSDE